MHPAADILLIDDDAATVRLLVELLRGRGFRLRVALDGRDGQIMSGEVVTTKKPDFDI